MEICSLAASLDAIGGLDWGTSASVLGSFLSRLQGRQAPVFVVATANDVTQLLPERLRSASRNWCALSQPLAR